MFLTGVGVLLYSNDDRPIKEMWDKFHEVLLLSLPLQETFEAAQPETATQLFAHSAALIQSLDMEDPPVFHVSLEHMMHQAASTAEKLLRDSDNPSQEEDAKSKNT